MHPDGKTVMFERGGKSVRLTVAGKIFFGEARDILQRTADAVEKAHTVLTSQFINSTRAAVSCLP